MKKNIKKIISVTLAVAFLIGIIPAGNISELFSFKSTVSAQEELKASGKVGDNVTYTFDDETGVVTLSGSGETYGYGYWRAGWGYDSYLEYNPFANSPAVKAVVVEEGITRVSDSLFYGCTNLESVTLSSTVVTIGAYTFHNCTSLKSIDMSNGVVNILDNAFENCTALKKVYLGKMLDLIQNTPFLGCESLEEFVVDPENTKFFSDSCGVLYGRNYDLLVFQYPAGRSDSSYTIVDGTIGVSENAFNGCSLTEIILPESLKTLWDYAFNNCKALVSIDISNVENIYQNVFKDCTSLKSVILPELTSINPGMFYGCSALENVDIPDGVIDIGAYAFYGCAKLKSIELPENVRRIEKFAFCGCSSLESFDYTQNEKLTMIKEGVFKGCSSLKHFTIPENVTQIYENAFCNCTSLEDIRVPASVTYFAAGSFDNCTGLTGIYINDLAAFYEINGYLRPLVYAGNLYLNDELVTDVVIPEGTRAIKGLKYCTSLKSVTIPDSAKDIVPGAFAECTSLESVTLGNGVENIYSAAFKNCTSLESIFIPGSIVFINDDVFVGCTNLTIQGYNGSYAQKYAKRLNIPFEIIHDPNAVPTALYLDSKPTKRTYELGEEFDPTGAELRVKYSDGTIKSVSADDVQINGFDSSESYGNQKVYFSYTENGVTVIGWNFTVVIDKQINAIYVTQKPTKTTYIMGEHFDRTGMTVVATFSDGTKADITNKISTSGFDGSSSGTKKMTVSYTYKGVTKTTQFSYIMKPKLQSIKITHKPNKLSYKVGDSFQRDGLVITAYYTDGTSKEVTDIKTSGYSTKTVGKQIITVTYTYGTQTRTAQFSIIMNE